jgi:hypothetical protein
MKSLDDIEMILVRMIELLCIGGGDWAVALAKVKASFESDSKYALLKLLSMYGGVGSLNDVVLYKNGRPLISENNELDSLRLKLYEICKKWSDGAEKLTTVGRVICEKFVVGMVCFL